MPTKDYTGATDEAMAEVMEEEGDVSAMNLKEPVLFASGGKDSMRHGGHPMVPASHDEDSAIDDDIDRALAKLGADGEELSERSALLEARRRMIELEWIGRMADASAPASGGAR